MHNFLDSKLFLNLKKKIAKTSIVQLQLDLRSVPLQSPFNYAEWKLKMVAYLESHDLLDVFFRVGKESYEDENDCLDENKRAN